MRTLPGNHGIQEDYVEKHILAWGDSIQMSMHPMSGLLTDNDYEVKDGMLLRPPVQVIHGQHRKLVLEASIRDFL